MSNAELCRRLRNISRGDHERGCTGREYVCSCDFDNDAWAAAEEAANLIERTRAAITHIREKYAANNYHSRFEDGELSACDKIEKAMNGGGE